MKNKLCTWVWEGKFTIPEVSTMTPQQHSQWVEQAGWLFRPRIASHIEPGLMIWAVKMTTCSIASTWLGHRLSLQKGTKTFVRGSGNSVKSSCAWQHYWSEEGMLNVQYPLLILPFSHSRACGSMLRGWYDDLMVQKGWRLWCQGNFSHTSLPTGHSLPHPDVPHLASWLRHRIVALQIWVADVVQLWHYCRLLRRELQ